MFKPQAFAEDRLEVLQQFIIEHPLALITSLGVDNTIQANLIPMTFTQDGSKGILRSHLARNNSHIEALRNAKEVLVIFTGTQSYITPELYATKKLDGKAVPTWNYSMVQARGRPQIIDDSKWLLQQVSQMTDMMEANNTRPWKIEDAPSDYIQSQLKAIIGLEIVISQIEGKFKVSQNQPDENRVGVEEYFREIGNTKMADYILNRGPIEK